MKKKTPTAPITASAKAHIGLDYTPQLGGDKSVSYGVAERIKCDRVQSAHEIIARRLCNFETAVAPPLRAAPTCPRHDLLLPRFAPDNCGTYLGLADHFEEQALPHQVHLIGILTLRFRHEDLCHHVWELSRQFLYEKITIGRSLPVVAALHIPSRAGRSAPPHIHAMILMRQLLGSDFGSFDPVLKGPGAKAFLQDQWSSWCSTHGYK